MTRTAARVFGFAGWSGSGKTTLIEQLIPRFRATGLRVALIKHAHHTFDIDHPGKDSYRHRHAGCQEVLVSSGVRWALMHELGGEEELSLDQAMAKLAPADLVLIEGFKRSPIPKLEIYRPALGKPALQPSDPAICAVATDARLDAPVPVFGLDEVDEIATFVLKKVGL